jgi:putative serine protease PepD
MSENEMNPRPPEQEPTPGGNDNPPASGDSSGWRPQGGSETPATPASPWAPEPSAPQSNAGEPTGPAGATPDETTANAPGPGATPANNPTSSAPGGSTPEPPTTQYPASQYSQSQYPQSQYPQSQYPAPQDPTAQYPAGQYPTAQYPGQGQPGQPGQPGQYPTPPYAPPSDQPGGEPAGATGEGAAASGGYPGDPSAPTYPSAGYPASSYPATGPHDPRRSRSFGMIALFTILGLVLAAGGGVAGAALMHNFDKNDTVTVTKNGVVVDNAPIIDRSSLASIASAVSPSVVSITTQNAEGSGVVLSTDGYILTNNHVAATASGQSVDVTFSNGSSAKATLIGTDPKTDLAVFKAQNVSNLTAAKFGNSAALQVGDTVLAIGSPLGLDGSVTAGIVSALNRTINETADTSPQNPSPQDPSATSAAPTIAGAIQTDAAINPGNSGGALVNTNGQVVGINTAIATNGADGNIGVGFSIPSNRAKQVADDLIKGTKISHPQLGVSVSTATNNGGAQIGSVSPGSAAATAGLKAGDVITAFNGQPVHTSDDLLDDVQMGAVGTAYTLTVVRGGQNVTVNVTLQESK